jgi:hypothetical protein
MRSVEETGAGCSMRRPLNGGLTIRGHVASDPRRLTRAAFAVKRSLTPFAY